MKHCKLEIGITFCAETNKLATELTDALDRLVTNYIGVKVHRKYEHDQLHVHGMEVNGHEMTDEEIVSYAIQELQNKAEKDDEILEAKEIV